MKGQYYSRQNLDFILYEVMDVLSLTKHPYFAAHDAMSCNMVLDTAENIADKTMRPYYKESDGLDPELIDGQVRVHKAIHTYYKACCDSGLMASCFDDELGGQQLPRTVYAAADFILGNAHNGFEMFTSLAQGAVRLLTSFASRELIDEFVPKLLNGQYAATMCLTEPQAGSSLSDISTEAVLHEKSNEEADCYRIQGQKIFISAGDHDVTENIVHLVLAKIKGSPKGTNGISLFAVPKKRNDTDGHFVSNDVTSIGLFPKMGQHSTPALHLAFGTMDNCFGYLIGEEGKGLTYMFQLMNTARLGVGLAGTYIASAAYYASLQYAKERPQGRELNNKDINKSQITIIHHADVRRMLFSQKAFVEGALSLVMQCYKYVDEVKIAAVEDKERLSDLLELLTPVAKTYGAEMGIISVNYGMQVLGGYGYTKDFILEQLARDIRVLSLYEGTTGIQAQAVLGRQLALNNGRSLQYWKEEVQRDVDEAEVIDDLKHYADWLSRDMQILETTTNHLLNVASQGDKEIFLSDATLYTELFGLVNVAWQWLKHGLAAQKKLELNHKSELDKKFYRSKIETMQFFFHYELVKTKALSARLMDKKVLTVWKEEDALL